LPAEGKRKRTRRFAENLWFSGKSAAGGAGLASKRRARAGRGVYLPGACCAV